MDLRNELKLPRAKIVDMTKYPKNPEPSRVLTLTLPLTTELADVLKCREMCYDLNDNQRKFDGGFGLEHELTDCEIKLTRENGSLLPLSPKTIRKFRIGHDAKDRLTLTLRVHFSGYGQLLEEWSDEINDKEFDASVLSLQGELFPAPGTENQDGAAGGKRVDMSAGDSPSDEMIANIARAEHGAASEEDLLAEFGPDDGECTSCNNRTPYEDDTRTMHVTGVKCKRTAGASLAAAATVPGGPKQRRRRGDPLAPPSASDVATMEKNLQEEGVLEEPEPVVQ